MSKLVKQLVLVATTVLFPVVLLSADATGVPKTLMADEIHPTDEGYELWLEAHKGKLQ